MTYESSLSAVVSSAVFFPCLFFLLGVPGFLVASDAYAPPYGYTVPRRGGGFFSGRIGVAVKKIVDVFVAAAVRAVIVRPHRRRRVDHRPNPMGGGSWG